MDERAMNTRYVLLPVNSRMHSASTTVGKVMARRGCGEGRRVGGLRLITEDPMGDGCCMD